MEFQTILALTAAAASALYLVKDLVPATRRPRGACGDCAAGSCGVQKPPVPDQPSMSSLS